MSIARRVSLLVVAIAAAALLLVGVFAAVWWSGRSDDSWIEASTGGTQGCVPTRCFDDSLDTIERRVAERPRRRGASNEFEQTEFDRIQLSRWLRRIAPLTAGLMLLAAIAGRRPGRRFALGHVLGAMVLLAATASALLALGVFKASELLGDLPHMQRGDGFSIAFTGAVLAAAVGGWVSAPMLATFRGAAPVLAALTVVGALMLAAGSVSTWCWSTQTSHRGVVRPIRSTTLLRATECYGTGPCTRVWLGGRWTHDPPDAVPAGRIAFAASVATAGCAVILAVLVLRRRSRRIVGHLAVGAVLVGAAVTLASSAWFVLQVPRLSPVLAFLGWGPVLAVSGAILSVTAALWTRGVLTPSPLPEAVAR